MWDSLKELLEALLRAFVEWVVRCIPQYNPAIWNDSNGVQYANNCYNYACDIQTGTFAQPGRATGNMYNSFNCAEVGSAASPGNLARRWLSVFTSRDRAVRSS